MTFRERYDRAKDAPLVMRSEEPEPLFRIWAWAVLGVLFLYGLLNWLMP